MMKFNRAYTLISLLLVALSCTKEEATVSSTPSATTMQFGLESIAPTRLSYGNQTNGGVSASFAAGDSIGMYAFYNNFFYYYNEYNTFAESVIFANQGLVVNSGGTIGYSPLRSWTFSTLYGTAPHTLDCIAYYPFREGYNPQYVNMRNDATGAATLEYYYVEESKANYDIDFMTAYRRYDDSATPDNFRTDMLSLGSIPLRFIRRTASLNFKVTKPFDYPTDIVVKGVTIYFDAYQRFSQNVDADSVMWWDGMTTNSALRATRLCDKSLIETSSTIKPGPGAALNATQLLPLDSLLLFPPDTKIDKVVFDITDDKVTKSYTWHPHIAPIEANKHYTLNLELDPARAN